jgi:hypothetical protein
MPMIGTAEVVAKRYNISREAQDEYSLESQKRTAAAQASGKRIRGHWKLLALEEKRPGQWQQTHEITIEIEGEDKPALITEWIMQFFV